MSPRLVCPAFLDPSNTANSVAQSVSRVINQYAQPVAPGQGRSPLPPIDRPGLHPFAYLGTAPVRGGISINGRAFFVAGATFAEVLFDRTVTHTGVVANDGTFVSMASSGTVGNQVMLVSAGLGYIFDLVANTLTQITSVNFPNPAICCEYMDGYFLVLKGAPRAGTRRIQWSNLADGTVWPSLSFLETSEAGDNLTAIIRSHREIWALGYRTTEVLYDVGDVNTVFAPLQGVFVEAGVSSVSSVVRIDNTIMWMMENENGQGMVMRADGYVPKRVSTAAVETFLQHQNLPTDAIAVGFQINGHIFFCLTMPRTTTDANGILLENLSWVYDLTTGLWTEWAHWDPTLLRWHPFAASCHVFEFNRHLVGSLYDGTVYQMSQDFLDDRIRAL